MSHDRLSLRAIEAFHAVVTLGSVAAAADQLSITQPAISHLLKSLESTTGLTLFRKAGRRLELTEDGQVFFSDVAAALPVVSNLQQSAEAIRNAKRGHVRIVCIPVVAEFLLPPILGRFMREHPHIEVTLEVAETHRSSTLLEAGAVDLALLSGIHDRPHRIHAELLTQSFLIAPAGANWIHDPDTRIDLASLQTEPFIALCAGSPFRYALDQQLAQSGLSLNIRAQVRTQSAIVGLVAAGVGFGIVDQIATTKLPEGVAALEFTPPLNWSLRLLSRGSTPLSTSAERLAAFLGTELASFNPMRSAETGEIVCTHPSSSPG